MTAATVGVPLSDLCGNFKRMVLHLDFNIIRRAHQEYCLNGRNYYFWGPLIMGALPQSLLDNNGW